MICGSRRKDGRMREILFKAKRIDNGEWIEGNHVYLENAHYIVPLYIEWNETEQRESPMFIRVDRKTLCQYTGLNDKNGKRIWEKDIISINTYSYMEPEEDYFGQVVYAEGWACWCIQQPDDERPIPLCECEGSYQTDRLIEGNIFDNPELLGQDGG